jgi:hypothetical protein
MSKGDFFMRALLFAIALLAFAVPAHAADQAATGVKQQPQPVKQTLPRLPPLNMGFSAMSIPPVMPGMGGMTMTTLTVDQKTSSVRIVVKGQEVARFDVDGLHVRGNVEHLGAAAYDKRFPPDDAGAGPRGPLPVTRPGESPPSKLPLTALPGGPASKPSSTVKSGGGPPKS